MIAPHNTQQNGVEDRKNIKIAGVARDMLHDQGLPLDLWVEACNTTVFVQNHSPHWILGMSTPEEAFSGKKLDVSYFKFFGSYVYFHVTKYSRKKIKPTTEIGIFVGYTNTPHTIGCIFQIIG